MTTNDPRARGWRNELVAFAALISRKAREDQADIDPFMDPTLQRALDRLDPDLPHWVGIDLAPTVFDEAWRQCAVMYAALQTAGLREYLESVGHPHAGDAQELVKGDGDLLDQWVAILENVLEPEALNHLVDEAATDWASQANDSIRGQVRLLIDYYDDPEFVRSLITEVMTEGAI